MNAPQARIARRPVHGVLLLDKPLGLSSNNALQKAKWLLQAEKAGHTGTLDPLATGVLPLCFGAATKFSQLQLDADKTYEAVARLGVKTSTGDAEGDVIQSRPVDVTVDHVAAIQARFTGAILQTNGWSFIPAFIAAGALTGIIGILIGLPALRMRGIYLAMATLAFAFIVEEVIVRWGSVTRGNRGMLVPDPVVFGYKMGSGHGIYYLSLVAFALVALAIVNLVRSRTGRALAAIRSRGRRISAASLPAPS